MNTVFRGAQSSGAVPLANAVFCVNCETISDSPHDACITCGSTSLVSLFRLLGGTLRSPKPHSTEQHAKYSLQITANVHQISAAEVNLLIELLSRLTEIGGIVESLHVKLDPGLSPQSEFKVA